MTDWSISLQVIDTAGYTERFDSLRAFRAFCESELAFWQQHQQKLGKPALNQPFISVAQYFKTITSKMDGWGTALEGWDEATLNNQLRSLVQNVFSNMQQNWLWSGQPFVGAYIKCFTEHGAVPAQAFIEYIVRKNTGNIGQADWFKGYLFGYEYQNQKSDILQRRKSEKASLEKLRNQYVDGRNQLFGETDALRNDIRGWDTGHRLKSNRRLAAQKRLNRAIVRNNQETFSASIAQMNSELEGWKSKVGELESLYQEKLKLKKPAEYWAKAAKRYGLQGSLWAVAIVAAIVVGLVYFHEFFITWLQGKQLPLQLNSLQGVVLFGAIAAVYAFLLRILSRLAFSAFHLMRDAEEREQLTYLYLALSNESAVDEKSREIVLQALFSRSETGLLAQESGPTMPGIEMIKAATGKG